MTRPGRRFADIRPRLDRYLDAAGVSAVWFADPSSFAWLTGGDNVVDRSSESGSAAVGYDGEARTVVTNNIEAERLATEQVPDDVTIETYPWHRDSLEDAVARVSPHPAAADFPVEGFTEVAPTRLRQPLTDAQVAAYRDLGQTVAAAVEAVCRDISPSTTEQAAAARLRGRLAEEGIDTPVALVGGADRAQAYRHYVPTEAPVGEYALVSVTARRAGLHASCTRTVAFDPPEWLRERHEAAVRIEATALAATQRVGRAGGTAGDVFAAIQSAYEAAGHPDEWRNHHQGGAAGYAGREWIATPGHEAPVQLPMAYAWNPTIAGAKSEGTVLVTDPEIDPLTMTGDWPTIGGSSEDGEVSLARPGILLR